jgi:hypothetical protein
MNVLLFGSWTGDSAGYMYRYGQRTWHVAVVTILGTS